MAKQKVDFNKQEDVESLVNSVINEKTGGKIKINMKVVGVFVAYLCISGIVVNFYLIVKLLLKLF